VHGARVPPFRRPWQSGNKSGRGIRYHRGSMGSMSSMSRATPDPDRAFRALARRLTARRAHELGARLWFVLGVLALSVAAFTYWQVRVPLDGTLRQAGESAAALRWRSRWARSPSRRGHRWVPPRRPSPTIRRARVAGAAAAAAGDRTPPRSRGDGPRARRGRACRGRLARGWGLLPPLALVALASASCSCWNSRCASRADRAARFGPCQRCGERAARRMAGAGLGTTAGARDATRPRAVPDRIPLARAGAPRPRRVVTGRIPARALAVRRCVPAPERGGVVAHATTSRRRERRRSRR
jgi:hypothetical protein